MYVKDLCKMLLVTINGGQQLDGAHDISKANHPLPSPTPQRCVRHCTVSRSGWPPSASFVPTYSISIQWQLKLQRLKWKDDWKEKFGRLQRNDQDCHQLMVTLGYLHTIWTTVCVGWEAGHALEMAQFGAAVEVQMSIQNAQKLINAKWCGESSTGISILYFWE